MANNVYEWVFDNVWEMRLRDGRKVYCDDDQRWWVTGHDVYFDDLWELLRFLGMPPTVTI